MTKCPYVLFTDMQCPFTYKEHCAACELPNRYDLKRINERMKQCENLNQRRTHNKRRRLRRSVRKLQRKRDCEKS